jgi:hypothetical protein
MIKGTRNVGSKLRGNLRSAAIDSGSAIPRRAAVATTNRISASPNTFHTM